MKNKILSALLSMLVLFSIIMPSVSFASYANTIPTNAVGTRSDIIAIRRPEKLSACTSDKTYTISATGAPGTTVKVYKYSSASGCGNIVTSARQIGASGFYSTVVELNDYSNEFYVYAENTNGSQVTKINITKMSKSTVNKFKNLTVTIRNFLK